MPVTSTPDSFYSHEGRVSDDDEGVLAPINLVDVKSNSLAENWNYTIPYCTNSTAPKSQLL